MTSSLTSTNVDAICSPRPFVLTDRYSSIVNLDPFSCSAVLTCLTLPFRSIDRVPNAERSDIRLSDDCFLLDFFRLFPYYRFLYFFITLLFNAAIKSGAPCALHKKITSIVFNFFHNLLEAREVWPIASGWG